ncbi:MAG: GNAT family N-acetyltransferase [Bacteroidales bacterium]|nr:GNAT family N-acetyltransferase [Bacteroidales bacterium]
MDLKISHAREQDIKEIQLLLKACDLPYEDISWNKQYFNIIRDDNNIKAVCGLEIYKDSALLRSFAVKEELRNKGVGVKLYRYTIEHGSREFNVHTPVFRTFLQHPPK